MEKVGIMGIRTKTSYKGVFYRNANRLGKNGTERVYYVVFKKNRKVFEEKVGRQYADNMTSSKAAMIRAQIVDGKRPSRREMREHEQLRKETEYNSRAERPEEDPDGIMFKEKRFLFMKSATEGFSLFDRELRLVELNDATLELFLPGKTKEDVIGKHLFEITPDSKNQGVYEMWMEVLQTGNPLVTNDILAPPRFGTDLYMNVKVFKVGDGLGVIINDTTDMKRAELTLKNREEELEEVNAALKVLLKKREEDKAELEEKVIFSVNKLIMPHVEKLKASTLDHKHKTFLEIIESNLQEIISPFKKGLSGKFLIMTPTEIQIANFIQRGKRTKEIAALLNLSTKTIDFHRDNIRKKLGIKNRKVNLRTYLLSDK